MSDGEGSDAGEGDALSTLQAKHRRENRDLQAEVQRLKKAVPKGDNKRKKSVAAEIEQLEAATRARHEAEVRALQESLAATVLTEQKEDEPKEELLPKQPSKAQKLREKKEQERREWEQRIKDGEVKKGESAQEIETAAISAKLKEKQLRIDAVRANGHCLFQAVANQVGAGSTVASLRAAAVAHMRAYQEEFLPFLTNDVGDQMSKDEFLAYLDAMENTATWGGQCELRALASVLHRPIVIYQATSAELTIGDDNADPILLTYHRRQYALGEHYNSVAPLLPSDDPPADAE